MKPLAQDQWKRTKADPGPTPPFRRLRGYAFDPSLSTQMETAVVNEAVFKVMWEGPEDLLKGPVGEYLEVIDYDPASGCFYAPIDLNSPLVLAQDGLAPSEGNPQFHQQMVYAVAMTTIRNFERALGRVALWAPDRKAEPADPGGRGYVQRLRIYPHALREANAYYSRAKIALLFGYFPASASHAGGHFPGGMVFTCLSHDIIAHETTHALLDGMHRRFIEPTHPDVLAFHEAFADIVALFQHFSFPEVLRHQIAKTRGDLASQNMLGQLAQQFGKAIGHYGALRDAIGEMDERTGEWKPKVPDPEEYQTLLEPHDRGAILVAAVFDAFISIYEKRVADLFRIATGGTGVLQEGALHPDLVNRLAVEAAKSAQHVLNMCIRALDYCPPVDITFGDYLRAMITADSDLVPDDDRGYRIAVIEAFRRRGVYPRDVRTLSVDSLRWQQIRDAAEEEDLQFIAGKLRGLLQEMKDYAETRRDTFLQMRRICAQLHGLIQQDLDDLARFEPITGLVLSPHRNLDGLKKDKDGRPVFEVHSVRPAQRVGPDGDTLNQAIIAITQKREVRLDPRATEPGDSPMCTFRGGCTLIVDLDALTLRYCIVKRLDSDQRLERQRSFQSDERGRSLRATYFAGILDSEEEEPFAMLHRRI